MPHDHVGPLTAVVVDDAPSTSWSKRAQTAEADAIEHTGVAADRNPLSWYEQLGYSAMFPNDYDDLEREF